jgi:thiamine biosynthesis protein ThiI
MKKQIIIIRYGEVSLNGMNNPYFEKVIISRLKNAFKEYEDLSIRKSDGLLIAETESGTLPAPAETLCKKAGKVFGVATTSPAIMLDTKDIDEIAKEAIDFIATPPRHCEERSDEAIQSQTTFKVFGKRSDKTFPMTSPDFAAYIGEKILDAYPQLKVDVENPEIALNVHIRRNEVFIYDEKVAAHGGLPLGTNGKGLVLLSGGIDSPVAAWLMAKRGMTIEAVHYHSYPYTSERAQEKVEELAGILASYCGRIRMHIVNLLPAQEQIAKHCPEELMTILVRRFMMKVAKKIAEQEGCLALITGESLGQVASQTAASLYVTDESAEGIPVFRPLIGTDKTEIMDMAREIGTYEKSIEPYEDCCTVFLPRHPATKPKLEEVIKAEQKIPQIEDLIEQLVTTKKLQIIKP